jgi:sugar lactone lactonase YvrE
MRSTGRPVKAWEEIMISRIALSLATLLIGAGVAVAEPQGRVLAQFDDAPEGLVADDRGNLYTTLFHTGRIVRIDSNGEQTVIGDLRSVVGDTPGSTIGLDWDGGDALYIAFAQYSERYPWPGRLDVAREACGDNTVTKSGLYRLTISSGKVEAVATRADGYPFCYPDDPAVAPDGSVYFSDLSFSGIWRYSPDSGEVVMWSKDRLFDSGPTPMSGFPVGVNGIAVSKTGDAIYGVTGGNPMLVRVPVNEDGTAGAGTKVAYGYDNMDGLEIDADGNFYVTEAIRHEVWKISPDIAKRQQLGNPLDAPLGSPASIAFFGDEICVSNLNFFGNLPPEKANTIVCASGIENKW